MGKVAHNTSILLFGCAGLQVLAGLVGACGIRWLNAQLLCTAVILLLLGIAALSWVAAATYFWLQDTEPEHPTYFMVVYGVATVADFVLLTTLLFLLCLWRQLHRDIRAHERTAENREEYSDYATRDQSYGRRGKRKKPKNRAPREYIPNNSL